MTRVTLDNLTMRYPGAAAAAPDGLTLDIETGSLTALLGPSGCGKTTILRIIAGLLQPTGGQVAFDGEPMAATAPEKRGAVMVFQNHLLFPAMRVAENIGFGLRMRGLPRAEIAARVAAMLDLVQLGGMGDRRPADLSGGQQQRVALARALVIAPRVLLLDEPLSNLDAHLRLEMRDLIRGLQRRLGITTLLVTHDQDEAVMMADRVAFMLGGKLRQSGPPAAFYDSPADIDVARFFGGVNFLPADMRGPAAHTALGPLQTAAQAQGRAILTIRPEAIGIAPSGTSPKANSLEMTLGQIAFLGTSVQLTLAHDGTTLTANVPPVVAAGLAKGQRVAVHLPPDRLWPLPDDQKSRS